MQSRYLRYGRHTAQSSTLIGSALADIVMGRTVTNPLGGMACTWADVHRKALVLSLMGAYCRMKDMVA
ncbi:hypothetical protein NKI82_27645 [Mesorhizobium sp. M0482]|uniref:hypothetical protein n=1 Tax=unclassified Mesorhizobium TaxID=325217 RepID=UPI00333E16F3